MNNMYIHVHSDENLDFINGKTKWILDVSRDVLKSETNVQLQTRCSHFAIHCFLLFTMFRYMNVFTVLK